MLQNISPDTIFLIYRDSNDEEHSQPVNNLNESGTLVNPETGDDMVIVGVKYVPQKSKLSNHLGDKVSTTPQPTDKASDYPKPVNRIISGQLDTLLSDNEVYTYSPATIERLLLGRINKVLSSTGYSERYTTLPNWVVARIITTVFFEDMIFLAAPQSFEFDPDTRDQAPLVWSFSDSKGETEYYPAAYLIQDSVRAYNPSATIADIDEIVNIIRYSVPMNSQTKADSKDE